MATTNDITGDKLISRANSDSFRDNFDRIFRKKKDVQEQAPAGDCEEVAMSELRDSKRNGCSGA